MEIQITTLSAMMQNLLKVEVVLIIILVALIIVVVKNILVTQGLQKAIVESYSREDGLDAFNGEYADNLFEKGDIKALTDYCDRFYKDSPNSVHISWYYGLSYYSMQDYVLARQYFEQVIKINPLWRDGALIYLQEIEGKLKDSGQSTFH